ncbi:MAG: serine/threonine protein kinase, partial [Phycisphaerales bacterium]|nr:serine/threonine protein kinase [Phycisphaerales bacterium]
MTTDGASTCPGTEQIELLAQGEAAPAMVLDHVAQCAVCSARLAAAKEDASFLARVRQLTSDELGPAGAPNIAGYRVAGTLGAGAQGVVYKAIQESTARTVAIKVMTPGVSQSPKQRFRAEREVEIAARLTHPNIVTVFESRTLWDGRLAVVMEYVDGMRMDTWARSGQVDRQDVLRAFVALCKGVHHAHLNGVIHRDLKPANVLVTPEGRPVVLDFGIAKLAGMQATLTGEFAGTPAYASPEQVRGKPDEIDGLSDVYSLGVMLYQALSGQMPYDTQGSILDIAKSIESSIPTGLARHVPGIPPDVEAIVMRALRKDKAERYQSAAGLARDIERYLSGAPVEARSTSRWYVLRKALALNKRRLAWIGVGVVAVAGAVLVVGLSLRQAAAAEREAALRERQAHDENVRARAVQELLRETFPVDDPNRPEVADAVRAGLMRLYFRLETGGFANDPQLDHTLRRMWGEIYTGIGAGEQAGLVEYAEVSLRSGLERLLEEHVGDHPDVAATMHDLAGVLYVRKRLPEADALCARALAMRERLFGNTGEAVASSLSLAAQIHVEQGRLDEARTEGDRALQILESLSGTDADIAIA